MIFAHLILLFLSFKYLRVTKVYIYCNLIVTLICEIGLPNGLGAERIEFMHLSLLMIFILDYFDFYPSIVCIIIVHLSQIASESILYGNEITTSHVISVLGICVLQFLQLFTIHIIITKVGMIFVESEIVRIGNDQILNNLKEGVIILN